MSWRRYAQESEEAEYDDPGPCQGCDGTGCRMCATSPKTKHWSTGRMKIHEEEHPMWGERLVDEGV